MTSVYRSPEGEREVMAVYGRILADLPPTFEQIWLDTRHGKTFALAAGDSAAPALLLLHGAGANVLAWTDDIPILAQHFRVYAVDTPGESGRSCAERISWTGPGVTDWVGDVLDALGIQTAILGGFSQGGYLALRFATTHPGRVWALMLFAPAGVTQVRRGFGMKMMLLEKSGRWAGRVLAIRRSMLITRGPGDRSDAARLAGLRVYHFCPRLDVMPLLTDDELRCLQMPLLLVVGETDPVFPSRETVDRVARLLPRAEIRLLPGVGHMIVGQTSLMLEFLERGGL